MGVEAGLRQRVQPVVLAKERRIAVPGPLGESLPGGGLQRGTVVAVDGPLGGGSGSVVLQLAAAATAAGEWVAAVDLAGTFGGLAAAEAGVSLDRLAVVRGVTPERWATVVAHLLEGVAFVAAAVPAYARPADARRLAARARERGAILVAYSGWPGASGHRKIVAAGGWPAEAALRLRVEGGGWVGLGIGEGWLEERRLRVVVNGREIGGRERMAEWPVPDGVPRPDGRSDSCAPAPDVDTRLAS